jgi:MFS family permease
VLGALLLASGLAKLFSSVVWGRWSDRSSRKTMMISGTLVFLLGAGTTLTHLLSSDLLNTSWLIPLIYFGLEIAHQGVRVARKTYIVDLTSNQNRVEYVALCNSLIGTLLLVTGVLLGLLATFLEPIWLVATLSLLSLTGVALGKSLREV